MSMIQKYQIKDGDGWETCRKAAPQKPGWLHYELRDGTIGLAYGDKWRIKPKEQTAQQSAQGR